MVGHNLIDFDLPRLAVAAPGLSLLSLAAIDTLWLSPLAFPRNPYHRLVKHYQDGGLLRARRNDPELDARLCLTLLGEELAAFEALEAAGSPLPAAWHGLTGADAGFDAVFRAVRGASMPDWEATAVAVAAALADRACPRQAALIAERGWPLAYALAWVSVAGTSSVLPPWVRHRYPAAARLIRTLRDTACGDSGCAWCGERHDATRALGRWFGHGGFRPTPALADGRPVQQAITEAALRREHVLGVLPTGTGKSVCYQVPALARYEHTGALTVVLSPLVALMEDQARGLAAAGVTGCAALNGQLSMAERADTLARIRLGDIAILLVSPEQLRNQGFRRAVSQREIGLWVLDEAHCLSKWGHDFRTDYRYVGRYMRLHAGEAAIPPVLCLTATAKPDVLADIVAYFQTVVGGAVTVFDGGARRENLQFEVVPSEPSRRARDIDAALRESLDAGGGGGAIVYAAFRRSTEQLAEQLRSFGWPAAHFHAGLSPEVKKQTQSDFLGGAIQVMVATNAFGMGIDKPDVRVVVHAEIPGSLENYVQEAGRAGRDQAPARCVLLYCAEDVENQFSLSARSRLTRREIQGVLRGLRRLAGKRWHAPGGGEVIATPGEILLEDGEAPRARDGDAPDTRVRTAVAWLEHAGLVSREENHYEVFPSTLRVASMAEVDARIAHFDAAWRSALRSIAGLLMRADPTEGVSTDELMGATGLDGGRVRDALRALECAGVVADDAVVTALVHHGVANSSKKRLAEAHALEAAMVSALREAAPDLEVGSPTTLHLRRLSQALRDAGHAGALPDRLSRILQGLAGDGRGERGGRGSLHARPLGGECVQVVLHRGWGALEETASIRREASAALLGHLVGCVPGGTSGVDLLVETTLGRLHAAIAGDLSLQGRVRAPGRVMERALLWMHEQEVLRLGRGLVVLRGAMRIVLPPRGGSFTNEQFAELKSHYDEQTFQIHVMAQYAQRGIAEIRSALHLAEDYFTRHREAFLAAWFPKGRQELSRETTAASWSAIVESLSREQRRVVVVDSEHVNLLVIAGPGSGKTRVLTHRVAYLTRVRREDPRGILTLAYNRHAAAEIRQRLRALIGDDARHVTVLTCHGLAMRLTGTSFEGLPPGEAPFARVLSDATALLSGAGLPPEDADAQRERLLAGFRWILVDEYQDIDAGCYALIAALAGRSARDAEQRISLFAVGDDDQNIYGFNGASVEYIRRFQADYGAAPRHLTENYRSSAHIVAASNAMIAPAAERMKTADPVRVDGARAGSPPGGRWSALDPVAQGRVQVVRAGADAVQQAVAVMGALRRLAGLDPDWDWRRVAVLGRTWDALQPVRSYCEAAGIPAHWGREEGLSVWGLRETGALLGWLGAQGRDLVSVEALTAWVAGQAAGMWWDLLEGAVAQYRQEFGGGEFPGAHFREWLAEWCRDARRAPRGVQLLTAHRAKGLEFDHVGIVDGGWGRAGRDEDPDAERRLYYVAMTRARETLTLGWGGDAAGLVGRLRGEASVCSVDGVDGMDGRLRRVYRVASLEEVDLGFAGRWEEDARVHGDIRGVSAGDGLFLERGADGWLLRDGAGRTVGRMSSKFAPPEGMVCVRAVAHAVVVRERGLTDAKYLGRCLCERWEVVVPGLVFGMDGDGD